MKARTSMFSLAAALVAVAAIGGTVQANYERKEPVADKPKPTMFVVATCAQGQSRLLKAGFSHVFATECDGHQFRYNAFRGKREVMVTLSALTGGHVAVSKNTTLGSRKN